MRFMVLLFLLILLLQYGRVGCVKQGETYLCQVGFSDLSLWEPKREEDFDGDDHDRIYQTFRGPHWPGAKVPVHVEP